MGLTSLFETILNLVQVFQIHLSCRIGFLSDIDDSNVFPAHDDMAKSIEHASECFVKTFVDLFFDKLQTATAVLLKSIQ